MHGANARYVHDGERLWVGSHTCLKRRDEKNLWWQVAINSDIENKLKTFPFHVMFGEVFGQVQDLKYGIKSGAQFRVFDIYDIKNQRYLDFAQAFEIAKQLGFEWVPILYSGEWKEELNSLCEGKTTFNEGHVREGFVVKPLIERWDEQIGRVILKRHGEGYLLRKKK